MRKKPEDIIKEWWKEEKELCQWYKNTRLLNTYIPKDQVIYEVCQRERSSVKWEGRGEQTTKDCLNEMAKEMGTAETACENIMNQEC